MRTLLNRKIIEQDGKFAIYRSTVSGYNEIVPDHNEPKGMGGAWRDAHPDKIQAAHGGAICKSTIDSKAQEYAGAGQRQRVCKRNRRRVD